MLQRNKMAGCLALAWLLALPLTVRCQTSVPPVEFTGPLSHGSYESQDCYGNGRQFIFGESKAHRVEIKFVEISAPRSSALTPSFGSDYSGPTMGVVGDLWQGWTSIGGFSASGDTRTSVLAMPASLLLSSGPGMTVHWYPWEEVHFSLRLDMRHGGITPTTSLLP